MFVCFYVYGVESLAHYYKAPQTTPHRITHKTTSVTAFQPNKTASGKALSVPQNNLHVSLANRAPQNSLYSTPQNNLHGSLITPQPPKTTSGKAWSALPKQPLPKPYQLYGSVSLEELEKMGRSNTGFGSVGKRCNQV